MPRGFSLCWNLSVISEAKAFIGERYTILKSGSTSWLFWSKCLATSLKIASKATLVLPAPVGADSNTFSSDSNVVLKDVD